MMSIVVLHSVHAAEPESESATEAPARIPATFEKVYETSFEDVRKKDEHRLTWEFPHWCEFAAMHKEDGGKGSGEGGGRLWVESGHARSGGNSIGIELFDIEKSRRAELSISPGSYLGAEYYLSYWMLLPEDWGLYDEHPGRDWYEIGNPYSAAGAPYSAIIIRNPDTDQKFYTVALGGRDEKGEWFTAAEQRLIVPKGRWFEVAFHVHRHTTNGFVKLWFDGQLIGSKTGFPTMHTEDRPFTVSIAKVYHGRGDKTAHRLWIDDLALFTTVIRSVGTHGEVSCLGNLCRPRKR